METVNALLTSERTIECVSTQSQKRMKTIETLTTFLILSTAGYDVSMEYVFSLATREVTLQYELFSHSTIFVRKTGDEQKLIQFGNENL